MQDLGTLPGGTISGGTAINNLGQVTGYAYTFPGYHAFLYTDGRMQDLGTLPGYPYCEGDAINDFGQVVGHASTPTAGQLRAFLYSDDRMQDLTDLIDPALGLTLTYATAINDHGQIVVNGIDTGYRRYHAYLLTPVPEPGTWALLSFAALLGLARQLRRRTAHTH